MRVPCQVQVGRVSTREWARLQRCWRAAHIPAGAPMPCTLAHVLSSSTWDLRVPLFGCPEHWPSVQAAVAGVGVGAPVGGRPGPRQRRNAKLRAPPSTTSTSPGTAPTAPVGGGHGPGQDAAHEERPPPPASSPPRPQIRQRKPRQAPRRPRGRPASARGLKRGAVVQPEEDVDPMGGLGASESKGDEAVEAVEVEGQHDPSSQWHPAPASRKRQRTREPPQSPPVVEGGGSGDTPPSPIAAFPVTVSKVPVVGGPRQLVRVLLVVDGPNCGLCMGEGVRCPTRTVVTARASCVSGLWWPCS